LLMAFLTDWTRRLAVLLALAAMGGASAAGQTLTVDQPSIQMLARVGGSTVSQSVNITSPSSATYMIYATAPWLQASPMSDATPSVLTLTANPAGLPQGVYYTIVSLYTASLAATIQVTLTVSPIGVSPISWTVNYQNGSLGTLPTQAFTLSGQAAFAATANSDGGWLRVTPASGNSPGTVVASLDASVLPTLAPGIWRGGVTITPAGADAFSIPVTLNVSAAPKVELSQTTLTFHYQQPSSGGTNNVQQRSIQLTTTSSQTVTYFITGVQVDSNPQGRVWLTAYGGGALPGSVQVNVDPNGLTAGSYQGTFTVWTSGNPASQTVSVKLVVSAAPLISVPELPLSFTYQLGGALPTARTVTVSSTSGALALSATPGASWLKAPSSAVAGTPFAVTVDPSGLAIGSYQTTLAVTGTGAGNNPQNLNVELKVALDPEIAVSAPSLAFAYQTGQAAPAAQSIKLSSAAGPALSYQLTPSTTSCGSAWLLLGSTGGTTDGAFPVSVDPTGIAAGSICQGSIAIRAAMATSGIAAANSPLSIPVALTVSSKPLLAVSQIAPVVFTVAPDGAITSNCASSAGLCVVGLGSTSAANPLSLSATYKTDSGGDWLALTLPSDSTPTSIRILAVPPVLAPGLYTGTVTVTATFAGAAAANSPYVIPVSLRVLAGTMAVRPTALAFSQIAGGATPAAQNVNVTSDSRALTYVVNAVSDSGWLSAAPSGTATPGAIAVTANGSKLAAGTYTGSVSVAAVGPNGTPAGGSPATVLVTLTVAPGSISASPASLSFQQTVGGSAPAAQSIAVAGSPGALTFSATSDSAWLTASPASGSTPASVQVSVSGTGLPLGSYPGAITIVSQGATGSPIRIPVTLDVVAAQPLAASPSTIDFAYAVGATGLPQPRAVTLTGPSTSFTAQVTSGASWLQVSPVSGASLAPIQVMINSLTLLAGTYTGAIAISTPGAPNAATITVNLRVSAMDAPKPAAITNAASYAAGPLAAGENVVIFGTGIGPTELAYGRISNNAWETTAGDTRVLFDDVPAPIIYAWNQQTSVMVPYEVSGRANTKVRVEYKGVASDALTCLVMQTAPGVYTLNQQGTGQGAILNQDIVDGRYVTNGPQTPAAKGSTIQVFMTGEGATFPVPATGAVAPASDSTKWYKPIYPASATIGGADAKVVYYGTAPGLVYGVMQINIEIPKDAKSGDLELRIALGFPGMIPTTTQSAVTVSVQ
jgi:uncharacterized protein (TIGR03437 family)